MSHSRAHPTGHRDSFLAKLVAAIGLVAAADALLFDYAGGSVLGAFALIWLGALVAARGAVLRAAGGRLAILAAALFALAFIDDPSLLAVILFLIAIGTVALLPRHRFDHAGLWFARLVGLGAKGPFRAPRDLLRIAKLPGRGGVTGGSVISHAALPIVGGGLFLALFASANPVLGNALSGLRLPDLPSLFLHALIWIVVLSLVWPTLRPRAIRMVSRRQEAAIALPEPPVATMLLTLTVFNAIFALENALDIAFLWSGAALPEGVTLAEYAHRGAYTLIATALLAGMFVLVALRPGSSAARHVWVRRLVLAWVAQNVLLVASSVLRLVDYIDAYSLTVLRISALAWMGLVAIGLVLICWRFLTGRSHAWLINANCLAALIVLTAASIVDLGTVAASWNVRHTRDPARLDLCYLELQGSSALLPLIELRETAVRAGLRERAAYLSDNALANLRRDQADWQSWTARGARRLARAEEALEDPIQTPQSAPFGRGCGGEILPPPPPEPPIPTVVPPSPPPAPATPAPAPLTPGENR